MLDDNQLRTVIEPHLCGEILTITEIIGKGFMNRTFFMETTEARYIIRTRGEDVVKEYQKEKWCMEQAKALSIPTAEVVYIGKTESMSFMIETYIEGKNALDCDNPEEVWFYIGKYARKLHTLPVSGFGLELADGENGVFMNSFCQSIDEQVDYNLSMLTTDDYFLSYGVYTNEERKDIIRIFDYIKHRKYTIGFNHGDLSRKNMLVCKDGSFVLLDYGCAIAHAVPFYDLTYIFGETVKGREPSEGMIKSFAAGYGITIDELNTMKRDIYAVMLLNAFDKVRWAYDHNDKETEYYASFAKKVLAKTLEFSFD